jgi:hypothetical protein
MVTAMTLLVFAPMEGTALERIRAGGTLRVGYDPDNLPMSFFNRDGQLAGLDVELLGAGAGGRGHGAALVHHPERSGLGGRSASDHGRGEWRSRCRARGDW